MAFGSFDEGSGPARPMAEINTTPLVDVMLVLLVIFMITLPLITHNTRLDLPDADNQPTDEKPDIVELSIDASGNLTWNNEALAVTDMEARMREAAQRKPEPELHLRADKTTQYQRLAEVMATAQRSGLSKMGFITDPVSK
jgi:biopolymer transport protein ExbD